MENVRYRYVLTIEGQASDITVRDDGTTITPKSEGAVSGAKEGRWTSTGTGKFLHESNSIHPAGQEVPSTKYCAFDGLQYRALDKSSSDTDDLGAGVIEGPKEGEIQFLRSGHETEENRANGIAIAGMPANKWIASPEARFVENAVVNDYPCYVIDVPRNIDGLSPTTTCDTIRFYFGKDIGFALVQTVYLDGAQTVALNMNTDFQETIPGAWFAVCGYRHDEQYSSAGLILPIVTFRVSELAINSELTDDEFRLEFAPGTPVRDEISGTSYKWGSTDVAKN